MAGRSFFPRILTRYTCKRFVESLVLCLLGLTSIYMLVEFFERLDNLIAQHLSYWVIIQYLLLRLPQVVFQIMPVAILMSTLLTLGGMAKDGELISSLAGGISLYQIFIPLIFIFLVLSLFSGLYQAYLDPVVTQKSLLRLARIKGEEYRGKLAKGNIWLAGKQGRFFYIRFLDNKDKSLNGVNIFEIDKNFQLKRRWDIRKCYYKNGIWHLSDGHVWRFSNGTSDVEQIKQKAVKWPEEFSDFIKIQKDPKEMGYMELKSYIKRLEKWGYNTSVLKTDLYFKWAFPLTCLIFGLLGMPFAVHLHRGVKYMSLGLSLIISFIYWIIMYMGLSMAHAGIINPVTGVWAGNTLFGFLGILLIFKVRT